MYSDQADFDLRCEWGLHGLHATTGAIDAIVIVDVLSFSTAVDVAVSNGAIVLPYRWQDESAPGFARQQGAVLASGRHPGQYSLSPASLRSVPAGTLLVLPSPNGSTLSLSTRGIPTFTACLRNARSVAGRVKRHGKRIALFRPGSDGPMAHSGRAWKT